MKDETEEAFDTLAEDHIAVLTALSAARTHFVVVGGYAVRAFGVQRETGDLDILVSTTPENQPSVSAAFGILGVPWCDAAIRTLFQSSMPKVCASNWAIEFLGSIHGVTASAAIASAWYVVWQELRIPVIGLNDLLANKRATASLPGRGAKRAVDLADIQALEDAAVRLDNQRLSSGKVDRLC